MELFPVSFKLDGKRYQKCKVIFDGTMSTIYDWDRRQRTAVEVCTAEGQPVKATGERDTYRLGSLTLKKGCLCNSKSFPLAKWRPGGEVAARARSG